MRELELLPRGIQSTEAWNYNTVNVTQGLPSYAQYFQNGGMLKAEEVVETRDDVIIGG